jgi:hypothetical protein
MFRKDITENLPEQVYVHEENDENNDTSYTCVKDKIIYLKCILSTHVHLMYCPPPIFHAFNLDVLRVSR